MRSSLNKTIYILTPLLIFILAMNVLNILDRYILNVLCARSQVAERFISENGAVVTILFSVLNALIEGFVMLKLMKRDINELSIWDYLNLRGLSFYRMDRIHSAAFSWILIGVQAVCGSVGLNILLGLLKVQEASKAYTEDVSYLYSVPAWVGLLYVIIVSPILEELIYRLVIFGRLKRIFPVWIATLCTSLFFGVMHGNIVQGIYAFLLGILMCMACEYMHTIVGSLIFHTIANFIIYILSVTGKLIQLNNWTACIVFCGITLITVIIQIVSVCKSRQKYGEMYGIAPVGCFFVDETLL